MDDTTIDPQTPHNSKQPRRSIEDNYPEYLEHEYGYAYEVADVMSQAEIMRHEELLHADTATLEGLELDSLDDFQKWAVARAWRRLGDHERFLDVSKQLLDSQKEHPVVIYSEISRWVAQELAGADKLEDAKDLLTKHLARWDSDVQARELMGIVEFLTAEGDDSTLRQLADEYPADAELRYEIAEDLWRFGKHRAAERWLDEARQAAEQSGDEAALVDIELLATRIANAPLASSQPEEHSETQ
ncbi:hypothetical protein FIV42_03370 [Persicimonas caeni]|uniref:Tetratricopeptide repeat protein n=1 Tax=Persicimonas caeni TaxID=2292766 RepID=A0A4Y6PNC8_PERCE|nr:hypothetical protein [Persicimonas caeni]QDG49811.1 hypothetical protein FIV42_03370 [Persicimonas caeni]QED31032.1 hypothetical protein FRD00_03365 [Persicimonas caeni]